MFSNYLRFYGKDLLYYLISAFESFEFGIKETDMPTPVFVEATIRGVLWKKLLLKTSQHSHENKLLLKRDDVFL